jgi:uracil-DNA glycosylase
MIHVSIDNSFEAWRHAARKLLQERVLPESAIWSGTDQHHLFTTAGDTPLYETIRVPAAFVSVAKLAACFDDPARWGLLYRLLFRLVFENKNLLSIESDADVRRVYSMAKAVRRDIHKFHAFVRFRRVECDGEEIYVAWHEPHHFTVEEASPFFMRRFGSMNFSILTPKGCAHWDRDRLTFSAPAERSHAASVDTTEEFWLLYYRSIFNPFRLKVRTMKRELPVRHWPTLPEARLIPALIRQTGFESPEA